MDMDNSQLVSIWKKLDGEWLTAHKYSMVNVKEGSDCLYGRKELFFDCLRDGKYPVDKKFCEWACPDFSRYSEPCSCTPTFWWTHATWGETYNRRWSPWKTFRSCLADYPPADGIYSVEMHFKLRNKIRWHGHNVGSNSFQVINPFTKKYIKDVTMPIGSPPDSTAYGYEKTDYSEQWTVTAVDSLELKAGQVNYTLNARIRENRSENDACIGGAVASRILERIS